MTGSRSAFTRVDEADGSATVARTVQVAPIDVDRELSSHSLRDGSPLPLTLPGLLDELDPSSFHPPPEPGQRVGRYLVEEVLGKGGMGLVLRARDDILQRQVAIKVILPQYLSSDPNAGLRFLREAEIVARLEHPHIISVLDAGLDSGVAFLAFAYVAGDSYAQIRNKNGPLPLDRVLELMFPILSATAYAHRGGVVHGDLKPTNLLLSRDYRGRDHPWVLDFGVSFFTDHDAGMDPTRGRISGTPGYLAPEWLEETFIDGRADCFSLGCVLYELLTGHGPFSHCERLSQAAASAKNRDYKIPSLLCRTPARLDEILLRALSASRDERYSDVDALARELLPFANEKTQARFEDDFVTRPPEST